MGHTGRQLTVDSGQLTAGEEESWRAKFRRAARVICKLDVAEREWRDLAIAEQAAAEMFRAERDFAQAQVEDLRATLRSTTVDLNRYFEELTKLRAEKNSTTDCTDSTDGEGTQRREGAKVGRPLPSGDVLAQVFWNGFESIRPHESRLTYSKIGLETHRHIEEGIQFVLFALGPHLRPADETAETLRGRLRQVMASLDEEKGGRLRAETRVQELEAALASARADHGEQLHEQAGRYEVKLSDLRSNHQNEIAGLQGMLADAERRLQLTVDSGQLTAGEDKRGAEMDGAA